MFDLKGKVALITGGASGIGAATARRLTAAGASVIVADLNEAAAKALADELPEAKGVAMDVTSATSIAAVIQGLQSSTSWSTAPVSGWWAPSLRPKKRITTAS